jgi:hypothetical protein
MKKRKDMIMRFYSMTLKKKKKRKDHAYRREERKEKEKEKEKNNDKMSHPDTYRQKVNGVLWKKNILFVLIEFIHVMTPTTKKRSQ